MKEVPWGTMCIMVKTMMRNEPDLPSGYFYAEDKTRGCTIHLLKTEKEVTVTYRRPQNEGV